MESEISLRSDVAPVNIDTLDIPEDYKELIRFALMANVRMIPGKVMRIWRIGESMDIPGLEQRILWTEDNLPTAGYQHILKHEEEFAALGISKEKLVEVAEAATTVGIRGGEQGRKGKKLGRPIFGLFFYGKPLSVAISVGSNGFVVGMNSSSWDRFKKETKLDEKAIETLASWPNVNSWT